MIYIILAFISGCLVLLSMVVNSNLAKRVGVFQGTFINYLGGLVITGIILLFINDGRNLSFTELANFPFWIYLGGVIGVAVVAASNVIIPKIPTIYSTLLIFIGQLFTGIALDYFTGVDVSMGKLIGGALILAGLFYNFRVDKKQESVQ
ncbi:MAG: DMT family transporter [Clostridium sp.]|nr:DMT family transporter [Clostridium sp.]